MKSFRILFAVVILTIISAFAVTNITLTSPKDSYAGRPYKVEASRIEQQISTDENINLEECEYITNIEKLTDSNKNTFYNCDSDYMIKEIGDDIYRFEYSYSPENNNILLTVNVVLLVVSVAVILLLIFIYFNIIKPFNQLTEMPFELAKGNLTTPLKEKKQRFFGRFVWGMDLLREKLEHQKTNELSLQKEKKTLVLSLSHDIKTPLGVIELYSKALQKDLYHDETKKKEVAVSISEKCEEIKSYVDEIIKTSNEDFLNLEVQNGEFYLSDLITKINSFYADKLELIKTDFYIEKYSNAIVKGDIDRSVEVLQNIIENAIKYGDGKWISLSFSQEEDCTIVSVSNSGSTLPDNELTHIFDSFWRGSNVGSNSGSGLGLYICRQLMHKMSGDIFADSKNNTMTVSLVFTMV